MFNIIHSVMRTVSGAGWFRILGSDFGGCTPTSVCPGKELLLLQCLLEATRLHFGYAKPLAVAWTWLGFVCCVFAGCVSAVKM